MLAQEIEVGDRTMKLNAFWDSGAQLTMMRHVKAGECGLRYHLPLVTVEGSHHTVLAYGVD